MRLTLTMIALALGASPSAGSLITFRAEGTVYLTMDPFDYPARPLQTDLGYGFHERAVIEIVYTGESSVPADSHIQKYVIESFDITIGDHYVRAVGGEAWVITQPPMMPLFIQSGLFGSSEITSNLPFDVDHLDVSSNDWSLFALNGDAPSPDDVELLRASQLWWGISFDGGSLSGAIDTLTITPAPGSGIALLGILALPRRRSR